MRATSPLAPLLLLALPTLTAAQGETGFLRGRGKLDLAPSYNLDVFDELRLENPVERFDDAERAILGLYAAYGLRDDLDLVLDAAYLSAEADGEPAFDDESDLQDLVLKAKWRVRERALGSGNLRWLLAPGVRLPLTDYTDFSENPLNGLGEGDTVLLGRIIAHYDWRGSYAALETGYDHRNGSLDDEIPLHLSLGATAGRVTYQAFLTSLYALGDEVSSPRLSDERDGYLRVGLGAYLRVSESFGLSLAVRHSDDGTNQSDGFSLGAVTLLFLAAPLPDHPRAPDVDVPAGMSMDVVLHRSVVRPVPAVAVVRVDAARAQRAQGDESQKTLPHSFPSEPHRSEPGPTGLERGASAGAHAPAAAARCAILAKRGR